MVHYVRCPSFVDQNARSFGEVINIVKEVQATKWAEVLSPSLWTVCSFPSSHKSLCRCSSNILWIGIQLGWSFFMSIGQKWFPFFFKMNYPYHFTRSLMVFLRFQVKHSWYFFGWLIENTPQGIDILNFWWSIDVTTFN